MLESQELISTRRQVINRSLSPNQHTMSLSFFPRAGADGQWTTPQGQNQTNYSMCSLPRYRTIPENILKRRQGRKKTHYPVYQDIETPNTFHDILPSGEKVKNHLCLDDLEVGIGCCSLQTTFQAQNETEARWLHDQLIPLAPIFLAMTAAVPIWKGYLVDTDIRWQRFGDLTDDRRPEEMETTVCQTIKPLYRKLYPRLTNSHSLHAGPGIGHTSPKKNPLVSKASHQSNQ